MKFDKEKLKIIQGWLDKLSEYGVGLSGDEGYLEKEEYDELPDEMEMEEIELSFPDDQEYTLISLEEFCSYMSEFDSIRREGDTVVRTNHIIQAVISSGRMGYSGFEEKLLSTSFTDCDIDVNIIQRPFLVGVMNAKDGKYEEDFGLGACEPYWAIEIRLQEDKDDSAINALIEQICYYLTNKLGVAIYPWEGPDINELYDRMDDYYNEGEDNENKEEKVVEIKDLPQYTPLLKMYRQAKGIDDPEIQFLQYYKIIEYVSPLVAKTVAYDRLNRRLDLLPSVPRDAKFLDSILAVAKKYDTDMRDDSLAAAVMENCVDVIPLYGMMPMKLRKKLKASLKLQKDSVGDDDVTEEQVRSLQKQIASILYATRNSIVHAKSNYQPTGNEISSDDLREANEMMDVIASSIINWNQRQPEGFRS